MSEWGDKFLTDADNARLRAENDKLRELIRHMRRCFNREYTEYGIDFICCRCDECEYDNGTGECDFERRMAELGVEVES